MKRWLFIAASALMSVSALAQTRADSIRVRLLDPSDRSVLVASHRGDWKDVPENSVASIEAAILAGADIVEVDVRRTLGGELILHHGPVLFRPADATSLEEALLASKGRVMINIDKAFRHFRQIVRIARKTGTLNQIIFKSGMRAGEAKALMGEDAGEVIFMPIIHLCSEGALASIEEYEKALSPCIYEWVFNDDSHPALTIAGALSGGRRRIWVNTMWGSLCGGHDDALSLKDPLAGYGWLIRELGVGAIQTDETAYLVDYLKNR